MNDLVPFEKMQTEMVSAFGKETSIQIFGFLSDILRPPAKELGGLIADIMRLYRWKAQIQIIQKTKEYIDNVGPQNPKNTSEISG